MRDKQFSFNQSLSQCVLCAELELYKMIEPNKELSFEYFHHFVDGSKSYNFDYCNTPRGKPWVLNGSFVILNGMSINC